MLTGFGDNHRCFCDVCEQEIADWWVGRGMFRGRLFGADVRPPRKAPAVLDVCRDCWERAFGGQTPRIQYSDCTPTEQPSAVVDGPAEPVAVYQLVRETNVTQNLGSGQETPENTLGSGQRYEVCVPQVGTGGGSVSYVPKPLHDGREAISDRRRHRAGGA